ncbi:MAG TPA: hypothetical protein VNI02_05295, partial [Blastocatellia bacterium]|nr:hypothetical protein [Blastocatellia bacterium]
MSKDTDNNFFIGPSAPRLYQHLLGGIETYRELGNRIISGIKAARAFRQVGRVRELSRVLTNYPIREYQLAGQYYALWCDGRESKYDTKALERIIERTTAYKTEAMLSLAAFEGYQGRVDASLHYYTEALKTSPSASDYVVLIRSIAALKSAEGFHESALRDLEGLLPIIRHAEPLAYYDFLNSYAVELAEAGRKQEAENISRVVLASPFAFAYPEWHETANDVRGSRRSFVDINSSQDIPHNVLFMPATGHVKSAARLYEPARVLDLQKWKKKM